MHVRGNVQPFCGYIQMMFLVYFPQNVWVTVRPEGDSCGPLQPG